MYPILGLVVLIAVIVWFNRRRGRYSATGPAPQKRLCNWTTTGDAKGRLQEFKCETCGVVGYSSTGNPPIECKRNLKTGS